MVMVGDSGGEKLCPIGGIALVFLPNYVCDFIFGKMLWPSERAFFD